MYTGIFTVYVFHDNACHNLYTKEPTGFDSFQLTNNLLTSTPRSHYLSFVIGYDAFNLKLNCVTFYLKQQINNARVRN